MDTNRTMTACVVAFCSGVYLGCIQPAGAGERARRVDKAPTPVASAPFGEEVTLPYNGYGRIDILDDGLVVLQIGGEMTSEVPSEPQRFVDESGQIIDLPAEPEIQIHPERTFAFQLRTSGVGIVEHGSELFLDRNDAQVRARGLAPWNVFRTPVPGADRQAGETQRYALLTIEGDLSLDFDSRHEILSVAIAERMDPQQRFSFAARYVSPRPTESVGAETDDAPSAEGDEAEISLTGVGGTGVGGVASGGCTATCSNGDCNVNCKVGLYPVCYCDTYGNPVCKCVQNPPMPPEE